MNVDARCDFHHEYAEDQHVEHSEQLAPAGHQCRRGLHAEDGRVDHDQQQNAALNGWLLDDLLQSTTSARFHGCSLHDAYLSVSIIALPATVGLPLNTVGRARVWWRRPERGSDGGARFVTGFDSVQAAL